uniref:Molybdopterin biosynthesis protein n=1 Tax=Polysiphonia sertularioides TaxID=945028 RepID=A0A1Z1MG61_9FLOR|nr:Molybdopterin biosynthesis protein [Polysiphonia sertularioides]
MLQQYKKQTLHISKEEYIRYSKQIILRQIGIEGQQKLKNTKILVIGAGGLGCPILLYLVSSGIGLIGILDPDYIEKPNLNRQVLYNAIDIGELKTKCAKKKLQLVNSNTRIVTHKWKLDHKNSIEVIRYYDIIIDATDNFDTRSTIDKTCHKLHKTYIHGAINEFEGELAVLNYKDGLKYENLYKDSTNILENNCNRNGIMGISTGYIGLLQTIETIKIILGLDKKCKNSIIRYSILINKMKKRLINPSRILKTEILKHNFGAMQKVVNKSMSNIIIDVREEEKFRKEHKKRSINIPFLKLHLLQSKLLLENYSKNRSILINCNDANRSNTVSEILNQYKINNEITIL